MNYLFEQLSEEIGDENKRDQLVNEVIATLQNKKVVIYGAATIGELLSKTLSGYEIQIDFFVDRRYDQENFSEFMGVPVQKPDSLKTVNEEEAVIIIAVTQSLINDLTDGPLTIVRQCAPKANVIVHSEELLFLLTEPLCKKDLSCRSLLNCVRCYGSQGRKLCPYYTKRCRELAVGTNKSNGYRSKDFYWFGYLVSQRCTLKCKLCCEKVPYIQNGIFVSPEVIIQDCTRIAQCSEFLDYIELIGGEPLLHPQISDILEGLLKIPNVGYIKMFTNGTVSPSPKVLEVLKNPRIVITFSNYLRQVNEYQRAAILKTKELFDLNHIAYYLIVGDAWSDYGDFTKRNLPREELEEKCPSCFIHNCHRLFQGKLYQCPIHYAFLQTMRDGKDDEDVIDIYAYTDEELAYKLDEVEARKTFDACDYCLLPFDGKQRPAGEQL